MNFFHCIKRGVLAGILTVAVGVWAQEPEVNHPELRWETLETPHFYVHFHQGGARTAAEAARIAESLFEPVTSLYRHWPDGRLHFIVKDHDDESNGAAYYYDNKIVIDASPMDFELRGTHSWLRNVVAHEFCHMISLGAARKMPRLLPAVYLQWFDYEKEKRPDVLQGYPNTLVSYPLPGTVIPLWFAEGMAQSQVRGLDYDVWDSHRDMLVRTALLEDRLLSIGDMGVFGKTSLGNERVYNQGYGLVLYLTHRYGEDVPAKLVREMRKPWRMTFSGALEAVIGKDEKALFQEWTEWLRQGYGTETWNPESRVEGTILPSGGEANYHPELSSDGKKMAWLSSRKRDYMSQLSLHISDRITGKILRRIPGVSSSASWSPDGTRLVYAKRSRTGHGSHYYDLYLYDLAKTREQRLTRSLRARQPDWSPDGRKLVFVVEGSGTSNLFLSNPDGTGIRPITRFTNGEQLFGPRWLDGGRVVFAMAEERHGRDIALIDSSGRDFRYLRKTENDERDPRPSRDGKIIYFSSDLTGVFNIYRMKLDTCTSEALPVTRVLGGAFMPSCGPSDQLVYSLFTAKGFCLACLDPAADLSSDSVLHPSPFRVVRPRPDPSPSDSDSAASPDSSAIPVPESSMASAPDALGAKAQPYRTMYSKLSFLPRLLVDYPGKVKIGAYFYGSDFLDRVSLLGGVAVNSLFDTDLFVQFRYRRLLPTLFIEAYQQGRHSSIEETDYRFDLAEVDAGADWALGDYDMLRTAFRYSRYGARMTYVEQGQKIKFPYTYHIGSDIQMLWTHKSILPSLVSDIAPSRGRVFSMEILRSWSKFLNGFEIHQNYGTLVETYTNYPYDRFFMDWTEYFSGLLASHSMTLHVQAGAIDRSVDSFYSLFAGGLDGMKGYPYYSLEGFRMVRAGMAYRFPVFRRIDAGWGAFRLDKLYLSVFGDVGNAWNGGAAEAGMWKRDVGAGLRLKFFSFYAYPSSLFFEAAYGLDRFTVRDQTYGREWRMYFGLLFDFLD